MNLFYKALGEVMEARTAHGITRTGPAKVGGKHLSEAPNAAEFAESQPDDLTDEDLRAIDAQFAPQVRHTIRRESTGMGLGDSTTPVCSCGWKGRPEYQHNDYMYSNLLDQERAHMASNPARSSKT